MSLPVSLSLSLSLSFGGRMCAVLGWKIQANIRAELTAWSIRRGAAGKSHMTAWAACEECEREKERKGERKNPATEGSSRGRRVLHIGDGEKRREERREKREREEYLRFSICSSLFGPFDWANSRAVRESLVRRLLRPLKSHSIKSEEPSCCCSFPVSFLYHHTHPKPVIHSSSLTFSSHSPLIHNGRAQDQFVRAYRITSSNWEQITKLLVCSLGHQATVCLRHWQLQLVAEMIKGRSKKEHN